jgi:hypothetical protein
MLLYLDLNCFNRPFDDQSQVRIAKEAQAVFSILERIENGTDQLTWSAVLTFENSQHPLEDRRDEIARWKQRASSHLAITGAVVELWSVRRNSSPRDSTPSIALTSRAPRLPAAIGF